MKRFLVLWMILIMLFSSTALANDSIDKDSQELENNLAVTTMIEPRYTYLGYITIGMDIDENGYLTYTGSAHAPEYDLRVTMYLQKSKNGILWDELESRIKIGYDYVLVDGNRTVPADDYYYRVKIIAEVLDSNRNVLETTTAYSSEERY